MRLVLALFGALIISASAGMADDHAGHGKGFADHRVVHDDYLNGGIMQRLPMAPGVWSPPIAVPVKPVVILDRSPTVPAWWMFPSPQDILNAGWNGVCLPYECYINRLQSYGYYAEIISEGGRPAIAVFVGGTYRVYRDVNGFFA
jgi:hypothetical protein